MCFETTHDFTANLTQLLALLSQAPQDAIVVAPEVCLSGFTYDRFDEAAHFSQTALEQLLRHVGEKLLIFTAITEKSGAFYNIAYALHKGEILYEQGKVKLFTLGGEGEHFAPAYESDIHPFVFEGIKIGILICFELRFQTLWQRLEGCDIIAIPAQWGKLRSEHFTTLSTALAIMNQCYVIASDANNPDTSGQSGIITPFGGEIRNNGALLLSSHYEKRTVESMRRYLNVGIA